MTSTWDTTWSGVIRLPSRRLIRGRGLRRPLPAGAVPEFGLYLLREPPTSMDWNARWLRWKDFRVPADQTDARDALNEAWQRSEAERVEVACHGGRGRTGTALACIAVPLKEAVAFVRQHYDARAVETPWQRRFVTRFNAA